MKPFRYERADGVASACTKAAQPAAKFIAGGTNLIDLMKLQIETPAHLVDINALPYKDIAVTRQGLHVGSLVRMSELAAHPSTTEGHYELYLMCDNLDETIAELERKGVEFTSDVRAEEWGLITSIAVPGGGELGLYEPRHPTAI